ncbi:TPA: signal peptidase II, partial [Pseudomonas aeruginosa]
MNTCQETTHAPTAGLWWGIAVALALFDQGLKFAIEQLYALGSSLAVSPFFNVVHARNTGAAFSF